VGWGKSGVLEHKSGHIQGRSDGGGYRYLYPPKISPNKFLWGKMTSERLFYSFIHPQKLLYPPKQISSYAPGHISETRKDRGKARVYSRRVLVSSRDQGIAPMCRLLLSAVILRNAYSEVTADRSRGRFLFTDSFYETTPWPGDNFPLGQTRR